MANRKTTFRSALRRSQVLIMFANCCHALCVLQTEAAPVFSNRNAVNYLSQFGYLPPVNPNNAAIMSKESFSNAISEFQSIAGIHVTGKMNAETAHIMTLPRCGVKDKIGPSTNGRSKRYTLSGSKWDKKSLTYKISKYPKKLDSKTVDREIARALSVWSEYTDLTFTPKSGKVDIEISFVYGDHGDGDSFDGELGVLAHAFYPGTILDGDVHFDASEKWTVNSNSGINLFQVAAHEFGHSLGLRHSKINSALMAPFYDSYEPNFKLHTDDIEGIQALYGIPDGSSSGSGDHPDIFYDEGNHDYDDEDLINNGQDICKDSQIDPSKKCFSYF